MLGSLHGSHQDVPAARAAAGDARDSAMLAVDDAEARVVMGDSVRTMQVGGVELWCK